MAKRNGIGLSPSDFTLTDHYGGVEGGQMNHVRRDYEAEGVASVKGLRPSSLPTKIIRKASPLNLLFNDEGVFSERT